MAAALYNDKDTTDELWKECARWLTRWGMLREDHRANLPEACIADLANILRDGVLLCKLLNKVDPGCIDMKDVNLKPTMAQFLCLHNIELFLRTCLISFSLKEHDLFDPLVLFELTNFHKVLCTLSKLSLSSKAQEGNILGFTAHKVKTKEEEVIYQSLKSV
jgi:guanine nucleotide exchange factor VAV